VTPELVADLLTEIVERGKTSGRPGSDHDLAEVLADGLDRYALARLGAVASSRLRRGAAERRGQERQRLIDAGLVRPR
jgi:hypothetical protein